MHRFLRSIAVRFGLGSTTLGLILPGCGSGLGEVVVQELSSTNPHLPTITAERMQHCFANYGGQLGPGRYNFNPVVEVDRDGFKRGVETPDMPNTAPDLAACTRIALGDMAIPSSVFNLRSTQSATLSNEVTPAQRSYLGSPALVVVVVVGLSEIVLEAGAYTVLFAVSVKVVDNAKNDVMEALRRRRQWENDCQKKFTECLLSSIGSLWGDVHGTSRCYMCFKRCDEDGWPSSIQIDDDMFATCNYLGN